MGKGIKGISVAIPFEGNLETVQHLLKSLNSHASLEQAKIIFAQNGNLRNLDIITKILQQ
mgnify:CR=1 FL=1